MRILKSITIFYSLVVLLGCSTGSSIVTGNVRPVIDVTEVKIYVDPPREYESIGIVEASSEVEISGQAAQNRAVNKLKKLAAKMGANGVLLVNIGNQTSNNGGFYSNGVYYSNTSKVKTASGKAIYVILE